jgi:Holliday junction resolvase RusA-like endonuclease
MNIFFEVPGKPQGKARARTTKFGTYTPEKTVLYENLIKVCYRQVSDYLSDKPLHITIEAVYEPVKSASKAQREAMLSGLIKPTKKPDIDNIAKVVLDALNGVAYKDDTQVIELDLIKSYGPFAKLNVIVREVTE